MNILVEDDRKWPYLCQLDFMGDERFILNKLKAGYLPKTIFSKAEVVKNIINVSRPPQPLLNPAPGRPA